MKLDKYTIHILSRYLERKETAEERQQLYQWYEEFGNAEQAVAKETIGGLQRKGRERLFAEINGTATPGRIIRLRSFQIAAACLILAFCAFSLKIYIDKYAFKPLMQAELKKIVPNKNKATLTLAGGPVVNLDLLSQRQSIVIGNAVIEKDSSGMLKYTFVNNITSANVMNTLQTAKGSQYSIVLSDGTKVYLNATSKLSFPGKFGAGDRVVKLFGEAYFEVKKTTQHSKFIVQTNTQAVEVLGTKFNINAYEDMPSVKTTLAEGSVRVTPVNKALASLLLKPNQQFVLNASKAERINTDASMIVAWKDGFFVFDGHNSDEIIREIGKWYDMEIEYKHEEKTIEYAGRIPKNISLDQLIKLLNYAGIKVAAFKNNNNQHKLIIN